MWPALGRSRPALCIPVLHFRLRNPSLLANGMRDANGQTIGSAGRIGGPIVAVPTVDDAKAKTKWPRRAGPFNNNSAPGFLNRRAFRPRGEGPSYRPNRGRSPLRTEIRALAINRRSIAAIRRASRELVGASATEAVLDIGLSFLAGTGRSPSPSSKDNLCIPDAKNQRLVCIAAFCILHRNIIFP
jgi:hypothetical protein